MKKIFLNLIIPLTFFIVCVEVYGQGPGPATTYIEYSYDAAGNRTQRRVIVIEDPHLLKVEDTLLQDSILQSEQKTKLTTSLFTEKIAEVEIAVFPNPTQGKITLSTNQQEQIQGSKIIIYNEAGTLLTSKENIEPVQTIDFSTYSNGIYYLKVIIKDIDRTYKIVKINN